MNGLISDKWGTLILTSFSFPLAVHAVARAAICLRLAVIATCQMGRELVFIARRVAADVALQRIAKPVAAHVNRVHDEITEVDITRRAVQQIRVPRSCSENFVDAAVCRHFFCWLFFDANWIRFISFSGISEWWQTRSIIATPGTTSSQVRWPTFGTSNVESRRNDSRIRLGLLVALSWWGGRQLRSLFYSTAWDYEVLWDPRTGQLFIRLVRCQLSVFCFGSTCPLKIFINSGGNN